MEVSGISESEYIVRIRQIYAILVYNLMRNTMGQSTLWATIFEFSVIIVGENLSRSAENRTSWILMTDLDSTIL